MNDIYFDERVKHNRIGNLGFELVNMQHKLVCQEYEIEKLNKSSNVSCIFLSQL